MKKNRKSKRMPYQRQCENRKKAFTLVEILTVVFLATLIIIASYTLYLISYQSYQRNSANAELTQNARIALERMSRDIRQNLEVLTALPLNPESGSPPSELKFQDGHNVLAGGQIQYVTYYLSGTDLKRKVSHYAFPSSPNTWVLWSALDEGGQPPAEYTDLDQIKAQKITSLQFWGEETITMHLAVSDGTSTYEFETKSLGRNTQ